MNKKLIYFLSLSFVLTTVFFACKKADDDNFDGNSTKSYFPLEKGHYVVYDVDSSIWDDFLCVHIHRYYQIKHQIADTFTDNQGRMSYRVESYIRTRAVDPWQTHDVMYVTDDGVKLEQVYNNLRFIKLIFPIKADEKWKGNVYIPTNDQDLQYFADWDYKYVNVDQPFTTDSLNFDRTVTVTHVDETQNHPEDLPEAYAYRTFSKEVFGYDIGMVYREVFHWTYDPNTSKCRKGEGVVMRAVEYN